MGDQDTEVIRSSADNSFPSSAQLIVIDCGVFGGKMGDTVSAITKPILDLIKQHCCPYDVYNEFGRGFATYQAENLRKVATVATLQNLRNALFDAYRPELHYMRGPGPKWREKHGSVPLAPSDVVDRLTGHGVGQEANSSSLLLSQCLLRLRQQIIKKGCQAVELGGMSDAPIQRR